MISSRRGVAVLALASALALVPAAVTVADNTGDKPDAETQTATQVGPDRATLQANVRPRLLLTDYWFEYGTTNAYGQSTPTQSAGLDDEWASVAKLITGLAPSTRYHFRIVARNALGTRTGDDKTFTTSAADGTSASQPTDGGESASDTSGSGDSGSGGGGSGDSGSENSTSGSNGSGSSGSDHTGSGSSSDHEEEPELGRTVGVAPTDGVVRIRKPQDKSFGAVDPDGTVPTGTVIDARHGKISLTTALPGGEVQTGTFWGGMFEVRQSPTGHGYADLYFRGRKPSGCPRAARLAAVSKRRRGSSLWGSDHRGRFRTHGRTSVATVRGTTWVTTERCGGTLTFVREGAVVVHVKHGRAVTVRAGHAFLARRPR